MYTSILMSAKPAYSIDIIFFAGVGSGRDGEKESGRAINRARRRYAGLGSS